GPSGSTRSTVNSQKRPYPAGCISRSQTRSTGACTVSAGQTFKVIVVFSPKPNRVFDRAPPDSRASRRPEAEPFGFSPASWILSVQCVPDTNIARTIPEDCSGGPEGIGSLPDNGAAAPRGPHPRGAGAGRCRGASAAMPGGQTQPRHESLPAGTIQADCR